MLENIIPFSPREEKKQSGKRERREKEKEIDFNIGWQRCFCFCFFSWHKVRKKPESDSIQQKGIEREIDNHTGP